MNKDFLNYSLPSNIVLESDEINCIVISMTEFQITSTVIVNSSSCQEILKRIFSQFYDSCFSFKKKDN